MSTDTPDLDLPAPVAPADVGHRGLLDLYIRPRRFFARSANYQQHLLVLAAALAGGLASAIDRIDSKLVMAQAGLGGSAAQFALAIGETWTRYWGFVAVIGTIGAGLLWLIGGWWYRLRLGWSGAVRPDPTTARQVYVLQNLVFALPALLVTIVNTLRFDNAGVAAAAAVDAGTVLVLVLLLWSVRVSYCAATTVFELKPGAARLWFFALPFALYLFVGGIVAAVLALFSHA
ncbi:hypothetical protein [Scleromatobacter humisilvae]|uniref:Yip1 domain-containing protein n=1 Tax=Scleromatobacter humisilvae TaxID=2897159 RepID=A0A9X1YQQ7_9BURK|nr:hypothetical protein [Scleromatobacter humisilvae]MCK9686331.1 hypothetical protein [Scleromatobacter humisilvae]